MKLSIRIDLLQAAAANAKVSEAEKALVNMMIQQGKGSAVREEVAAYPESVLKALLDNPGLTPNQRGIISMRVMGMTGVTKDHTEVWEKEVIDPVEFGSIFVGMGVKNPNCEMKLNGRWYPITLLVAFPEKRDGELERMVVMHVDLKIADHIQSYHWSVTKADFLDETAQPRKRKVGDVLGDMGFRKLETRAVDHNLRIMNAEIMSRQAGKLVSLVSSVLVKRSELWWKALECHDLGTEKDPKKAIVENELELVDEERGRYFNPWGAEGQRNVSVLPFVRVFSLELKKYVYADISDIEEWEYDENALQKLVLPAKTGEVIGRLFHTDPSTLTTDVVRGKSGGLVILAEGETGTGKTLTAEQYAEQVKKPLYVLEMGELGVTVQDVEQNLQRVFARVIKWGAVLLFDEVDVFLTKRDDNLNRSAIVGIFLRLLDYYRGVMFMTTNRADVLDPALRSRVVLKIKYPALTEHAKHQVWELMLKNAGLQVSGDYTSAVQRSKNGRQIRNLVRLAKIMFPQGTLTPENLMEVCEFGCE